MYVTRDAEHVEATMKKHMRTVRVSEVPQLGLVNRPAQTLTFLAGCRL